MATKDYCLSFKGEQKLIVGDSSKSQYSNLNLNHNNQSLLEEIVTSKSIVTDESRKIAITGESDLTGINNSQKGKDQHIWSNSKHNNLFSNCFEKELEGTESHQKDFNKTEKLSNKYSSSTLSLHISAYENNSGGNVLDSKIGDANIGPAKKCKNAKQLFSGSNFESPFEFPRQQKENQSNDPKVMQFKASQKLLNPNQTPPKQTPPKPATSPAAAPKKSPITPLTIDIAFKWGWGKKKPAEEEAKTPTTGSTTTTCSTVTTTPTCTTADTSTVTPESTNFKTLETGEKSKSLSKTVETEGNETKTGMAIDTIEDSNEDDEATTQTTTTTATSTTTTTCTSDTSTMTASIGTEETQNTATTPKAADQTQNETVNSKLQKEDSTQENSATAEKKLKTLKTKTTETGASSNESESESGTEDTASTAASDDDGAKLETAEENVKHDSKSGEKLLSQRRAILFRHAERIDRVFPAWIQQSNSNGTFRPYNSNHPKTLPKRRGGLAAYEADPPITEIGRITAQLTGQSLKRSGVKVSAIFSSPALRCIKTAQIIARELEAPPSSSASSDLKIKIEYGLFDWASFYEIPPTFMTTTELVDAGINVAKSYRSILSKENFYKHFGAETKYDYYRRSHDVIHKILTLTLGTVIIIGHATTIDSSSRAILELPKSIPSTQNLDRLSDRYPYCTSVVIEQSNQNGQWRLGKSLLPITFHNQTTKFDKQFLLRK